MPEKVTEKILLLTSGLNYTVWRYWAPPVLWALVIMLLSGNLGAFPNSYSIFKWVVSSLFTLPPKLIDKLHLIFRKALHVVCYGVLGFLWLRALKATRPRFLWSNILLALLLSLGVALVDEGHQHFLTTRSGSLWDVVLDMSGASGIILLTAHLWGRNKTAIPSVPPPSP